MPRMLVLTDNETATGFRLAGIEVRESDPQNAQKALNEIILSDDYGLVVVDESLISDPNKSSERIMRGRDLPVLLNMPSLGAAFTESDDSTEYMKTLVRDTIGFDVKMD